MHRMLPYVDRLIASWKSCPLILVVEDDPKDGELMSKTLTAYGCTVDLRTDVKSAAKYLRESVLTIDLIFLDLKLHESDGVEVLNVVKQVQPDVPVVLVTGYATGPLIERALAVGNYVGVVNKPLTPFKVDLIFNAHKINK